MSFREFYSSTLHEVMMFLSACKKRELEDMKRTAVMNHSLAGMVRSAMHSEEFPSVYSFFPSLFPEEAQRQEEDMKKKQMASELQYMLDYTKYNNAKKRGD